MTAFVDTSALYALLVRNERRHSETRTAFEELLSDDRRLWTTSYVLVETTALLQHRIGVAPVRDLYDRLLPLVSIRWVDEALHRRGYARLLAEDRRELSLVDCVSLEAMRMFGARHVLALDPHLAEDGARLLPSTGA